MHKTLTREQWYALDEQFSRTPEVPNTGDMLGEHLKLVALLNRFGFHPMSKEEAMKLAQELLDSDWLE